MRPTVARIHLDRLQDNLAWIKGGLNPHVALMAVVKANGYGHGAVAVAHAALGAGASWIGVALVSEGAALRREGIDAPILVLGQPAASEIGEALAWDLDLVVFTPQMFAHIAALAEQRRAPARVHLKLDTGMGRIGILPGDIGAEWLMRLHSPWVDFQGVMTHFANADSLDPAPTRRQAEIFLNALETLRLAGFKPRFVHAANSAATLKFPGTQFNLVRVGIAMYGLEAYQPLPEELRPVMELRSEVTYVKEVGADFPVGYGSTFTTRKPMKIVTVPIGYADGYRRSLSNRAQVLIMGRRYPVVGRISMDQLTVGAPLDDPVAVGDRVTLIGEDSGAAVTADGLAREMDTIGYEIVTGISSRVPRVYDD